IQLKGSDLFENTLMLRFRYDHDEFTWEGIRTNWTLERGQREFICLNFDDVSYFKRIIPEKHNNKFRDVISEFYSENFSGTYESESSSIHEEKGSYKIAITLPYLLGKITISFDRVMLRSKIGLGEQIASNTWQYKDLETGVPFDFYRPFE
ncbi:MAG: hypothetical protein AAFU33_26950, partial [Bacteroidota bacterium]